VGSVVQSPDPLAGFKGAYFQGKEGTRGGKEMGEEMRGRKGKRITERSTAPNLPPHHCVG